MATSKWAAVAVVLLAAGSVVSAQNIAWRTEVRTKVPAGAAITMANAEFPQAPANPWLALVTFESGSNELYQYRAMAIDPSSGDLLWSHDLGETCETEGSDFSLVVPMTGGDSMLLAQARSPVEPDVTCIKRMNANGSSVVWGRELAVGSANLNLYALVPATGDTLIAGGSQAQNGVIMRLDAQTGATLWTHEIAVANGTSTRVEAIANGNGAVAVVLLVDFEGVQRESLRLIGINLGSGEQQWSLSLCAGSPNTFSQRSSSQIGLRMLSDGSLEYVCGHGASGERLVAFGRINAQTGAPLWQRELEQSFLGNAVIESEGSLLIQGNLLVQGERAGLARFSAVDGSLLWSLPAPVDPPGSDGTSWGRFAVAGPYLQVLEADFNVSEYLIAAKVATYAVNSGQLLARHEVRLPEREGVLFRHVTLRAQDNGDVLIGALSGWNRAVGLRLFETRMQGMSGLEQWWRQTPVMALLRMIPSLGGSRPGGRQMLFNEKGEPGVVLAGVGVTGYGYTYPRVAKVSALDGRILWRWEPDKRVNGEITAIVNDSQGNLVISGTNGEDDPRLLLARLDGDSGQLLWEASMQAEDPAVDLDLDSDANMLLLAAAGFANPGGQYEVTKRSAAGAVLWNAALPTSVEYAADATGLLVAADGSVIAFSNYEDTSGAESKQVVKLRSSDGNIEWQRQLPGSEAFASAQLELLASGDVVVVSADHIWRLDGASGSLDWQSVSAIDIHAMIIDGEGQIVLGGGQSDLRAIARVHSASGDTLWSHTLPPMSSLGHHEAITALGMAQDGNILAAGGTSNEVTQDVAGVAAVALLDGALIWQAASVGGVYEAAAGRGVLRHAGPVSVLQAPDGNIFFSGPTERIPEWTAVKITGPFADGIYASGFD